MFQLDKLNAEKRVKSKAVLIFCIYMYLDW